MLALLLLMLHQLLLVLHLKIFSLLLLDQSALKVQCSHDVLVLWQIREECGLVGKVLWIMLREWISRQQILDGNIEHID